jgi:hypothetical protein
MDEKKTPRAHKYLAADIQTFSGAEIVAKMTNLTFMVRQTMGGFLQRLDKIKSLEGSALIYSMWRGYLEGRAANRELIEFLKPYDPEMLHTSGHATAEDIAKLYRTVNPKEGLIPIHTEAPEEFKTLISGGNIILLRDGETLAV